MNKDARVRLNQFLGVTTGAWVVFVLSCGVCEFKWWAYMVWVPWLAFATLAPVVWWWMNRKPNATSKGIVRCRCEAADECNNTNCPGYYEHIRTSGCDEQNRMICRTIGRIVKCVPVALNAESEVSE